MEKVRKSKPNHTRTPDFTQYYAYVAVVSLGLTTMEYFMEVSLLLHSVHGLARVTSPKRNYKSMLHRGTWPIIVPNRIFFS